MNIIQGELNASNFKFAIILSRFNEHIGNGLLDGALKCFSSYKCPDENIDIIKVPGAFELPVTAQKLAAAHKYNAIVCLGAVIRGGTPHFEFVAGSAADGILKASLDNNIPVIFGVLTTDTYEQAIERITFSKEQIEHQGNPEAAKETGSGNKGWDAALTAIEMADLFSKLDKAK